MRAAGRQGFFAEIEDTYVSASRFTPG